MSVRIVVMTALGVLRRRVVGPAIPDVNCASPAGQRRSARWALEKKLRGPALRRRHGVVAITAVATARQHADSGTRRYGRWDRRCGDLRDGANDTRGKHAAPLQIGARPSRRALHVRDLKPNQWTWCDTQKCNQFGQTDRSAVGRHELQLEVEVLRVPMNVGTEQIRASSHHSFATSRTRDADHVVGEAVCTVDFPLAR